MANIYNYVNQYGNKSFQEESFNEIDNLVFSALCYLDFSHTNINSAKLTLEYVGNEYLMANSYKEVSKLGIAQRDAYRLLQLIIGKERYKNIIVTDYVYDTNKEMQFSAMTFHISKKLKCLYFEGTDELISGWKEDFELAYSFPVPSQKEAIKYVNKHVKLFGPNVIIGGHSKGGNLALISAMFMKFYKKFKVKKVYSNDGPGLRKKEYKLRKYKKIKRKYIHIVPDYSIVGMLFCDDIYRVIKTNKKNMFCHAMVTWEINNNKLVSSTLSDKSLKFKSRFTAWLDRHTGDEIKIMTDTIFGSIEKAGIRDTYTLFKIPNAIKVIHKIQNVDQQSKKLIIDLLNYNYDKNLKKQENTQKA